MDLEQIAWEQPEQKDWLKALVGTVKEILIAPTQFFQKVALGQNLKRPLWFAIMINTTMFTVAQAFHWGLGFSPVNLSFNQMHLQWLNSSFSFIFLPFAIVLVALMVVVTLFVGAGINHFCLYLLGAANRNFEQTLRVSCYACAPYVLCFVPVVGGVVGWLWAFVLMVIGLKTVHMTSTSRALLACLLPLLLCCGLTLLLAAMLGATALGALMMNGSM